MGDAGTFGFGEENENEEGSGSGENERGSRSRSGNDETIAEPVINPPAKVSDSEKFDRGIQVPHVDSTSSGPNDKGVQVSEDIVPNVTRTSVISRNSSHRSITSRGSLKGLEETATDEFELDDCLCQCDSTFDKASAEEPNLGEGNFNIEDKLLVGALKVTSRQVTFSIYTIVDFEKVISESEKLTTKSPQTGYFEQNAQDFITLCYQVMNRATYKLSKIDAKCLKKIQAFGITNQADAVVCWDTETQESITPIILGKDSRTMELMREWTNRCGSRKCFQHETGLFLNTSVPALKYCWLLDNDAAVKKAFEKNTLKIGTLDSWIIWNLTNGAKHITDYTNAARTMLMNIQTLQWDPELMHNFGIVESLLPEIKCNSEYYGKITNSNCSLNGIDITASICIPNSALIGTSSVKPGDAIGFNDSGCTYVAVNMGHDFVISQTTNQTIVAYKISKSSTVVYAQEGVVSGISGAANYRSPSIMPVTSFFSRKLDGTSSSIEGRELDRLTNQIENALNKSREDSGIPINKLTMVGDVTKNDMYMQTQANRSKVQVIKPSKDDSASVGAAMLAAHGENLFSMNDKTLAALTDQDKIYNPDYAAEPRDADEERDENEREEPPAASPRASAGSAGRNQRANASSNRGIEGTGNNSGGDGGDGNGFPIKWEEIDLRSGCILLLIALALMILGHMIGNAFSKEPEPIYIRRCRR